MNILITPPEQYVGFTDYPLTLADLKKHIGITNANEDARLQTLIKAAYYFAKETNRCFLPQVWELHIRHFQQCIEIPKSPVISVNSIKYIDNENNEVTLDPDQYFVYKPTFAPCHIEPFYYFPVNVNWLRKDAVRINYTVGYSTTAIAR